MSDGLRSAISVVLSAEALSLAAIFTIASLHKAAVVTQRQGAGEPLLQTTRFRAEHANRLISGVAAAELGLAVLVILRPVAGFAAAAILLGFYWYELRLLSPLEGCNCFGRMMASRSIRGARRRNLVLIALCVVGSAMAAATNAGVSRIPLALALAALACSVPAASSVLTAASFVTPPRRRGAET